MYSVGHILSDFVGTLVLRNATRTCLLILPGEGRVRGMLQCPPASRHGGLYAISSVHGRDDDVHDGHGAEFARCAADQPRHDR